MALSVLITGDADYIGSHMVIRPLRQGCQVTVLDNLSTGHWDAAPGADFIEGEISRKATDAARTFGAHFFGSAGIAAIRPTPHIGVAAIAQAGVNYAKMVH